LGLLSGAPSDERDDERVREAEDAAGEAGRRSDDVERSLVRLVAVGVHLAAVRLVRRVEAARAVLGGGRSLEVLEVLRVHEVVGVGVPEGRGEIGGERVLEVESRMVMVMTTMCVEARGKIGGERGLEVEW